MFILYSLMVGLVLGFALGGRPAGLAMLRFRWSALMLAGMLVQVMLFSEPITERIGAWGPPIYVTSTALVLAAVVANASIPGMALVAVGAASNLAAIVANGGYMPAARSALIGARQDRSDDLLQQHDPRTPGARTLDRHLRDADLATVRERVQRGRHPHRGGGGDDDRGGDAPAPRWVGQGHGIGSVTGHVGTHGGGLPACNSPFQRAVAGTEYSLVLGPAGATITSEGTRPPTYRIVQGKPVARRGRKARDLSSETARLPVLRVSSLR